MDIPKWSWEEESLLCCNDANVLDSITDIHYRYFMMYSLNSTDNLHFYVHCCRQRFCLGSPLRVIFHPYLCTIPCYSLHSPIVLSHTCRYIFVILWMKVFPSGFLVLLMEKHTYGVLLPWNESVVIAAAEISQMAFYSIDPAESKIKPIICPNINAISNIQVEKASKMCISKLFFSSPWARTLVSSIFAFLSVLHFNIFSVNVQNILKTQLEFSVRFESSWF